MVFNVPFIRQARIGRVALYVRQLEIKLGTAVMSAAQRFLIAGYFPVNIVDVE
jgi:hypothetical protein